MMEEAAPWSVSTWKPIPRNSSTARDCDTVLEPSERGSEANGQNTLSKDTLALMINTDRRALDADPWDPPSFSLLEQLFCRARQLQTPTCRSASIYEQLLLPIWRITLQARTSSEWVNRVV
jgi:hypothetical protein